MTGRPSTRKPSEFGRRLTTLREKRGLTQAALAELVGMTQQQVTYYERRAKSPAVDVVQRIAAALDVPLTALVPGTQDKPTEDQRRRRGRPSEFEIRWERVKTLPKSEQQDILELLDLAIERAQRRTA